jgi:integrase
MSERVHGPYKHGNKWRLVRIDGMGGQHVVSRPDWTGPEGFERAKRAAEALRRTANNTTVAEAVSAYLETLQVRPGTLATERHRLTAFLRLAESDPSMRSLTPDRAAGLFALREAEVRPDTLAGELSTVSRWARWCRREGRLSLNPFDGLEVRGPRAAGKPQLDNLSEARRFLGTCLEEDSLPGVAAVLALLTGMRASEITSLTCRDIDDGGRLVWIRKAKTKRGVRRLRVPELLAPILARLAEGREPTNRLWGDVDRHWLHYHVTRLCDVAKVPRVTPHGLRGTWATFAVEAADTKVVAATLGHDARVTLSHYARPGADQSRAAGHVALELGATPGVPVRPLDSLVTTTESSLPVSRIECTEPPSGAVTNGNDSCARGDSNPHGVTH